ncbi:unnamed protein product, partial [Iphiclides podalirius]
MGGEGDGRRRDGRPRRARYQEPIFREECSEHVRRDAPRMPHQGKLGEIGACERDGRTLKIGVRSQRPRR